MDWQDWVDRVYEAVDGRDAEAACAFLTDDVTLRYGNQEPWHGREAVQESLKGFFGMIGGQKHTFTEKWKVDDAIILQGLVDYTRTDGNVCTVPFAVIYKMDGGLANKVDIVVDASPVFAP